MEPSPSRFLFIFLTAPFLLITILFGFLWMQTRSELRMKNQEVRNLEEQIGDVERNLKESVKEESESEVFDTSDWKTYRNEKYGFEFKHPGDWTLSFPSIEDIVPLLYIFFQGEGHSFSILVTRERPNTYSASADSLSVPLSIDKYETVAYLFPTGSACPIDTDERKTLIRLCSYFDIQVEHQHLWYLLRGSGQGDSIYNSVYSEIFSTFKFIPSTGSGEAD